VLQYKSVIDSTHLYLYIVALVFCIRCDWRHSYWEKNLPRDQHQGWWPAW